MIRLPEFLAGDDVDALDAVATAVATVQIVRTRQIQTPIVGRKPGGSDKRPVLPAATSRIAACDAGGEIHDPDCVAAFGVRSGINEQLGIILRKRQVTDVPSALVSRRPN